MHKLQLTILPGEYWYGGHTNYGYLMPVNAKKVMLVDTTVVRSYGQANTSLSATRGGSFGRRPGLRPDSFSAASPAPAAKPRSACTRQTTTPCAAHITMR